jgi:hypothetical protein
MADLIVGGSNDPAVVAAQERVKLAREAEAEDRADRAATSFAEDIVRQEIGEADYSSARVVVQEYMRGLSPAERQALAHELKLDGTELLDADQLRAMGRRAIGEMPKDAAGVEAELAEIRKHMANHGRPPYYSGPGSAKMQLRYRLLLKAKGR